MKKRKILLSVALATAALFGLASCGNTDATTTTTAAPAQTTTTTTTAAPAQTTTTTTPATTTTTTTQAAIKYNVTFATKVDGTITDTPIKSFEVQKIEKNGHAVAPTASEAEVADYEFLGFEDALGATFDFTNTAITKATTIYACYHKITVYDTLKNDPDKIFAYDFNDSTESSTIDSYPGITNESMEGGSLSFANKKLNIISQDKDSSTNTKKDGEARVTLNATNSLVKGTFVLSTSITNSIQFVTFCGENKDADEVKYWLGSNNGPMRCDIKIGSAETVKHDDSTTEIDSNDHLYYFEFNAVTGKLTVNVDGKETYVKNVETTMTKLKYISFGSTKGAAATVTVDNIAIVKSDLGVEAVRDVAIAEVQGYASDSKYEYAKTTIDGIISKYTDATTGTLVTAADADAIATELGKARDEFADAIADKEITIKFYTEANGTVVKTFTKSFELGHTFEDSDFAASGYVVKGFYTDATLATEITAKFAETLTEVAVKVETTAAVTTTYTFDYSKISTSDLTPNGKYYVVDAVDDSHKGKETDPVYGDCYDESKLNTEILQKAFSATVEGTAVTTTPIVSVKTGDGAGQVTYRDGVSGATALATGTYAEKYLARKDKKASNAPSLIEAKGDSLVFTFTGTGTITLQVSSTGSKNSSWFALKKGDTLQTGTFTAGDFTVDSAKDDFYKIEGSTAKTITFNITEAGTYTFTTSSDRSTRIKSLTIVETA